MSEKAMTRAIILGRVTELAAEHGAGKLAAGRIKSILGNDKYSEIAEKCFTLWLDGEDYMGYLEEVTE